MTRHPNRTPINEAETIKSIGVSLGGISGLVGAVKLERLITFLRLFFLSQPRSA